MFTNQSDFLCRCAIVCFSLMKQKGQKCLSNTNCRMFFITSLKIFCHSQGGRETFARAKQFYLPNENASREIGTALRHVIRTANFSSMSNCSQSSLNLECKSAHPPVVPNFLFGLSDN